MYLIWSGAASPPAVLQQAAELATAGLPWDVALCYRDPAGDVDAWSALVADVVTRHGHQLAAVQVTGEPNLHRFPAAAGGAFPAAIEAMVDGVLAAANAKRGSDASAAIGFAVVPEVDPAVGTFWPQVVGVGDGRPSLSINVSIANGL